MSILFSSDQGWIISHKNFVKKIYENTETENFQRKNVQLKSELFEINGPFLRYNQNLEKYYNSGSPEKISDVKKKFCDFIKNVPRSLFLCNERLDDENESKSNDLAKKMAQKCLENSNKPFDGLGKNVQNPTVQKINDEFYIFPKNCEFFNKNIENLSEMLINRKFDVILMDPPWWNKSIRRSRKRKIGNSYDMLFNIDLIKIPVEKMLNQNGLVVIWCTNSEQNYKELVNLVLKKWDVEICATWYWVKVTKNGEPICKFSKEGMKQPYEKILIAKRRVDILKKPMEKYENEILEILNIPDGKIIVSVPSAINSHKPPLAEILKPFIREDAKCLEIFARYLLPHWTSWGLEAIKLQHLSLYEETGT